MAEPNGEFPSCGVCGRSLLHGEQLTAYLTPDGEEVGVCALCKERAESSDWIPKALAGERTRAPAPRRRSRIDLRELLPRRPSPAEEPQAEEEPARAPGRRPGESAQRPAPPPPPEPEPTPEPPGPAEEAPPPAPAGPVEAFNASPHARTVAGLRRSLGEPQASVRERGDGHLITIAWELSWYQWRVVDGTVEEVAKGSEIDELAAEDTAWNASLSEGGELGLA